MRRVIWTTICGAAAILFAAQLCVAAGDGGDQAGAKPAKAANAPAKAPAPKSKQGRKYGATVGGKSIGNEHIEFGTGDDQEDRDDPEYLRLGDPSGAQQTVPEGSNH